MESGLSLSRGESTDTEESGGGQAPTGQDIRDGQTSGKPESDSAAKESIPGEGSFAAEEQESTDSSEIKAQIVTGYPTPSSQISAGFNEVDATPASNYHSDVKVPFSESCKVPLAEDLLQLLRRVTASEMHGRAALILPCVETAEQKLMGIAARTATDSEVAAAVRRTSDVLKVGVELACGANGESVLHGLKLLEWLVTWDCVAVQFFPSVARAIMAGAACPEANVQAQVVQLAATTAAQPRLGSRVAPALTALETLLSIAARPPVAARVQVPGRASKPPAPPVSRIAEGAARQAAAFLFRHLAARTGTFPPRSPHVGMCTKMPTFWSVHSVGRSSAVGELLRNMARAVCAGCGRRFNAGARMMCAACTVEPQSVSLHITTERPRFDWEENDTRSSAVSKAIDGDGDGDSDGSGAQDTVEAVVAGLVQLARGEAGGRMRVEGAGSEVARMLALQILEEAVREHAETLLVFPRLHCTVCESTLDLAVDLLSDLCRSASRSPTPLTLGGSARVLALAATAAAGFTLAPPADGSPKTDVEGWRRLTGQAANVIALLAHLLTPPAGLPPHPMAPPLWLRLLAAEALLSLLSRPRPPLAHRLSAILALSPVPASYTNSTSQSPPLPASQRLLDEGGGRDGSRDEASGALGIVGVSGVADSAAASLAHKIGHGNLQPTTHTLHTRSAMEITADDGTEQDVLGSLCSCLHLLLATQLAPTAAFPLHSSTASGSQMSSASESALAVVASANTVLQSGGANSNLAFRGDGGAQHRPSLVERARGMFSSPTSSRRQSAELLSATPGSSASALTGVAARGALMGRQLFEEAARANTPSSSSVSVSVPTDDARPVEMGAARCDDGTHIWPVHSRTGVLAAAVAAGEEAVWVGPGRAAAKASGASKSGKRVELGAGLGWADVVEACVVAAGLLMQALGDDCENDDENFGGRGMADQESHRSLVDTCAGGLVAAGALALRHVQEGFEAREATALGRAVMHLLPSLTALCRAAARLGSPFRNDCIRLLARAPLRVAPDASVSTGTELEVRLDSPEARRVVGAGIALAVRLGQEGHMGRGGWEAALPLMHKTQAALAARGFRSAFSSDTLPHAQLTMTTGLGENARLQEALDGLVEAARGAENARHRDQAVPTDHPFMGDGAVLDLLHALLEFGERARVGSRPADGTLLTEREWAMSLALAIARGAVWRSKAVWGEMVAHLEKACLDERSSPFTPLTSRAAHSALSDLLDLLEHAMANALKRRNDTVETGAAAAVVANMYLQAFNRIERAEAQLMVIAEVERVVLGRFGTKLSGAAWDPVLDLLSSVAASPAAGRYSQHLPRLVLSCVTRAAEFDAILSARNHSALLSSFASLARVTSDAALARQALGLLVVTARRLSCAAGGDIFASGTAAAASAWQTGLHELSVLAAADTAPEVQAGATAAVAELMWLPVDGARNCTSVMAKLAGDAETSANGRATARLLASGLEKVVLPLCDRLGSGTSPYMAHDMGQGDHGERPGAALLTREIAPLVAACLGCLRGNGAAVGSADKEDEASAESLWAQVLCSTRTRVATAPDPASVLAAANAVCEIAKASGALSSAAQGQVLCAQLRVETEKSAEISAGRGWALWGLLDEVLAVEESFLIFSEQSKLSDAELDKGFAQDSAYALVRAAQVLLAAQADQESLVARAEEVICERPMEAVIGRLAGFLESKGEVESLLQLVSAGAALLPKTVLQEDGKIGMHSGNMVCSNTTTRLAGRVIGAVLSAIDRRSILQSQDEHRRLGRDSADNGEGIRKVAEAACTMVLQSVGWELSHGDSSSSAESLDVLVLLLPLAIPLLIQGVEGGKGAGDVENSEVADCARHRLQALVSALRSAIGQAGLPNDGGIAVGRSDAVRPSVAVRRLVRDVVVHVLLHDFRTETVPRPAFPLPYVFDPQIKHCLYHTALRLSLHLVKSGWMFFGACSALSVMIRMPRQAWVHGDLLALLDDTAARGFGAPAVAGASLEGLLSLAAVEERGGKGDEACVETQELAQRAALVCPL